jgi:hypothetical protein
MAVMLQTSNTPNNRMHADSKKRRSSFLVALLFAAGDASRSAAATNAVHLAAWMVKRLKGSRLLRRGQYLDEVQK